MTRALDRKACSRLVALMLGAAALSGCISLLPASKPAQLYRFGPAPGAAAEASPRRESGVAIFRTNGSFEEEAADDRILTVTGSGAAYIAQSRWVGPAQGLFDEAVSQAFEASPVRLIARGQQGHFAYALRLDVRTFETRYEAGAEAPPVVVVRVHAVLNKSDQTLAGDQIFEARIPAEGNRVGLIVGAYDKAVADVLGQLVRWTVEKAV